MQRRQGKKRRRIRFRLVQIMAYLQKKQWMLLRWSRIVSIYSVIYTAITLLNSVLYLCNGIYEDPGGNWPIILLIGIAAFELCTTLPVKPLALRYLIAYIPFQLLAYVFKKKRGEKGNE